MYKDYNISHEFSVHCLSCGKQIPYGRSDKKFCTVECKNKYHNTQRVSLTSVKQEVRGRLSNNYKILKRLVGLGINNISLSQVKEMGFDLRFVSKIESIGNAWIFYCYDISYQVGDTRMTHIAQVTQYSIGLPSAYGSDKKGNNCCKNHGSEPE